MTEHVEDHEQVHHEDSQSLDSFFSPREGDEVTDVDVTHDTVTEGVIEHHDVHEHEPEHETLQPVKKKPIYKKLWFWLIVIPIVLLLFLGLLIAVALSGSGQQSGLAVPDTPRSTPQKTATVTPAPAPDAPPVVAAPTSMSMPSAPTKPVITTAPMDTSAMSPVPQAMPGLPSAVDQMKVPSPDPDLAVKTNAAELDAAKLEIKRLTEKLSESGNHCNSATTMALSKPANKHTQQHGVAVAKAVTSKVQSEAKDDMPVMAGDFHVVPGAIAPGQAVVVRDGKVRFLAKGSLIDGAVVTEINPDTSTVKTTKGVILP